MPDRHWSYFVPTVAALLSSAIAATAMSAAMPCMDQTAVATWLMPVNGAFGDPRRWSNGPPGPLDVALFGATGSTEGFTVTVALPTTLAGLTASNQRPVFDLAAASRGGAVGLTTANLTIAPAVSNGQPLVVPSLTFRNGSASVTGSLAIGGSLGPGNLTVQDGTLTMAAAAQLSPSWKGTIALKNAALVHDGATTSTFIGYGSPVYAELSLEGASELVQDGPLLIGSTNGHGTLTVEPGGTVWAKQCAVGGGLSGAAEGGVGAMIVNGGALTATQTLAVGSKGSGTLTLRGGAVVDAPTTLSVGSNYGTGHLIVDGSASIDGTIKLGDGGNATLEVTGPETLLAVNGSLTITGNGTFTSSANIHAGSSLTCASFVVTGGGGSCAIDDAALACTSFSCVAGSSLVTMPNCSLGNGAIVHATTAAFGLSARVQTIIGANGGGGIVADASATLKGRLDVVLAPGFVPPVGAVYSVIGAPVVTGSFVIGAVAEAHGFPALVRQDATGVDVRFTDSIDALTIDGATSLPLGYAHVFVASAEFDGATYVVTPTAVWTSDDVTVATVESAGKIRGVGPGRTTIRASFGSVEANIVVSVAAPNGLLPFEVASRTPLTQGNGDSSYEDERGLRRVSADGRAVAFPSQANNLVPVDTNGATDIFVREWPVDGPAGSPERVSVTSSGGQASTGSWWSPVLDPRGRFVGFGSHAALVGIPHPPNTAEAYVRDRALGTTELVTVSMTGGAANKGGTITRISDDGRYVLFESSSTDLVPGDTNGRFEVFLRDRLLGTTERISTTPTGGQLLVDSGSDGMSADGHVILLSANNIDGTAVPTYPMRLFAIDRTSGMFEEITAGFVFGPSDSITESDIDDTGRFVVFVTAADAPGLPPTETRQVYLHDRMTRETIGVTMHSDGTWLSQGGYFVAISGHGRFVSFVSRDPSLTRLALPPNSAQAYRYDRVLRTTELATLSPDGLLVKDEPEWTALSADGRTLAFSTTDDGIGALDSNGSRDVIMRRFGSGIAGDINGDAFVDAADLAALIGAWGTTDQSADLDGDGAVGPMDLGILLGGWSPQEGG